jgi:hypothetical protein
MDRQANQRAALARLTLNGADAAWGGEPAPTARQTDLIMAIQLYEDTDTAKIALVKELREAVIGRFGPVAGRTILQWAGE